MQTSKKYNMALQHFPLRLFFSYWRLIWDLWGMLIPLSMAVFIDQRRSFPV